MIPVLIVEDERDYAFLLQESLKQALKPSCELRHCFTLGSAITELKTYRPSVILLDLNLPDSLGLDTIRAMHSAAPDAAIIVVTASGSEYLARLMLRGGAQDFLTKDEIEPSTLRRAISYALERKRTENELRNSRSQVRQLEMSQSAILRATTAALASLRYDCSIVWTNEAMNQLCTAIGRTGRSLEDLFETPADFREYTQIARRRVKEANPYRKELVLTRTDGQSIYCELSLVPLDPSETAAGYLATIIDVTDRANAENQRESLMRLTHKLTGLNTLQDLGRVLAEECQTLFGHDAFWFSLFSESERSLHHVYVEDTEEGEQHPQPIELDGKEVRLDYTPPFASGQPRLVNRASAEDSTNSNLRPIGNTSRRSLSLMFAPIMWEESVIGVLSTQSYTRSRYSEAHLNLLQSFADQCGVVMARLSAESEMLKQEALYRGIVQDQTELISRVAPDGYVTFANRAMAECVAHTYHEVVGRSFFDLVAPEDRERVRLHLGLLNLERRVAELEHGLVGHNGEVSRFVWTYRAIFEHDQLVQYQMVGADVTRLRLAESALARTEQRLELIVRQIPGILYTLDDELRFTSLMGRGITGSGNTLGSESQDLLGTKLSDLLGQSQKNAIAIEAHMLALHTGITADFVVEFEGRQYQSRVEPLRRVTNEICGIVGVSLDVTEQLQAEQEQRRLAEQLQEAERLAGIGGAMATIGHCMKNMLTGLNGSIFLVDRVCDSSPGENPMLLQAQDLLRRSTARISLLLLNMLDLSRERQASYMDVCVTDLITEVVTLLRSSASAEGITVESMVAPEAHQFQLDPDRLYRAILNLGLNALDALALGGRLVLAARLAQPDELAELHAAVERFESGAEDMIPVRAIAGERAIPTEPLLRVDIADNGSGMSREVLGQLFKPFFSTKYSRGTGLGLAATLQFIQSHGGHIFVRSRENFGTTFTLLLPTPVEQPDTNPEHTGCLPDELTNALIFGSGEKR